MVMAYRFTPAACHGIADDRQEIGFFRMVIKAVRGILLSDQGLPFDAAW